MKEVGEEDEEVEILPSNQWRPVHPDPLVLGVLVSDADPEGFPVTSGQQVPHEGLAGGVAGGEWRTSYLHPVGGAAESYLLLSRGDDGQVSSFALTVVPAGAPAQERL